MNQPNQSMKPTLLAVIGVLLTSCASSYQMTGPGRALPNNAVAILRQSGGGPAMVMSVDGKPYDGGYTYAGIGYNKWELLPGKHRVEVNMRAFSGESKTSGPQTVTFNAVAGQVYDVSATTTILHRSGNLFFGYKEVGSWKPAIILQHPVTDADRVKARR
jgi:hypothetical protein